MKKRLSLLWLALMCGTSGVFADDFVLYSGTITDGNYLIVYGDGAMKASVTTNRLDYSDVTPDGDRISISDAALVWKIAANEENEGYFTLYNESTSSYAASTGAKNKAALNTSVDDKALWTITGEETYEFVNKANAAASVNSTLRRNGTYGFACYATSTGGTLSLYKKVETANAVAQPSISGETSAVATTTVAIECDTEGAAIYYTLDGSEPSAESTLYTAAFELTESATVNAIAIKDGVQSAMSTKDFTILESIANTQENPLTVSQAIALIAEKDATTLKHADNKVYVTGTVKEVTEINLSFGNATYVITDEVQDMTVYRGMYLEGAQFTEENRDELAVGATVTVLGNLTLYNTTNELAADNQLVSITAPEKEAEVIDIALNPESGDIAEALATAQNAITEAFNIVGNITITLNAGGSYTLGSTLTAPANFTLKGDAANPATITVADEMTDYMLTLNGTSAYAYKNDNTESDHKLISNVEISGVKITGLQNAVVRDAQKTLVEKLTIADAVIEIPASGKNVLDFNSKGYIGELVVSNATIYAKAANTGFFVQYGSRPKNVNEDWLQTIDVQNSTFVYIANGKNFCNLKQSGTAQNVYTVKNNIFVNCGKQNQVIVGFNNGQQSATPVWTVSGNAINWGDADATAAETEKASQKDGADIVQNSVKGIIAFTDLANGDLNGNFSLDASMDAAPASLGDPRWTIAYTFLPADIALNLETGCDISKAVADTVKTFIEAGKVVNDITVTLKKGETYTVSDSIVVYNGFTIDGDSATIDASALAVPMLQMTKAPVVTATTDALGQIVSYPTDGVVISGVTIKGLAYQLFYANKVNYLLSTLEVSNSVIGINGANNKTIFDFNGGGNTVELKVENSTIWANPSNAQNGGFYSSQSGQSVEQLGGSQQLTSIKNSTLYNIASGKTLSTRRANNKEWMTYEVQNSVFVNCGKSGQVVKGLNAGQSGANPTWSISGNVFNFDGNDTSADESTGDDAEPVQNSIAGIVAFTDAANGDLNGTFTYPFGTTAPESIGGDPRWTISVVEGNDTGISNIAASVADGATFNLYGQRTNASFKGFGIKAGKVIFQK